MSHGTATSRPSKRQRPASPRMRWRWHEHALKQCGATNRVCRPTKATARTAACPGIAARPESWPLPRQRSRAPQQHLVHASLRGVVVRPKGSAASVPVAVVPADHRLRKRLDIDPGASRGGAFRSGAPAQDAVHLCLHLVVAASQGGAPCIPVAVVAPDDRLCELGDRTRRRSAASSVAYVGTSSVAHLDAAT